MSIYKYKEAFRHLAEEHYDLLNYGERVLARKFLHQIGRDRLFVFADADDQTVFDTLSTATEEEQKSIFATLGVAQRITMWLRLRHLAFVLARVTELQPWIQQFVDAEVPHRQAFAELAELNILSLLCPAEAELLECTYETGRATTEGFRSAGRVGLSNDEWRVVDEADRLESDALDDTPI